MNVGNIGKIGNICNVADIGDIGNIVNIVDSRKIPDGCFEKFLESFSREFFSRKVF